MLTKALARMKLITLWKCMKHVTYRDAFVGLRSIHDLSMSFFLISFFFGWESLNNLWKDLVLRIYVENSKLFVCVSDAFFRQPRLMGFFFTFSTLEGPTNAYYFVILKVLLIYFGNLQHEKGFGFQSLKGDLLHASSWGSSIFLWELCNIIMSQSYKYQVGTLNIVLILWHTQMIVCSVKCS